MNDNINNVNKNLKYYLYYKSLFNKNLTNYFFLRDLHMEFHKIKSLNEFSRLSFDK